MSRRSSQPYDIYEVPPYTTRCVYNHPCCQWNDCNSYCNYTQPCCYNSNNCCCNPYMYLKKQLPRITEIPETEQEATCEELQICTVTKNPCVCEEPVTTVCCTKKDGWVQCTCFPNKCCKNKCITCCPAAEKCVSKIFNEPECVAQPQNDCCTPNKCCIIFKPKREYIKTTGVAIMLILLLFAWLLDGLFSYVPKCQYRYW